jgi:GNAT superfamily N-acetyltransferase
MTELPRLAERVEAEFMDAYESFAPSAVRARIGGGVALAMRDDPTTSGYWNKALGFGITEPVTAEVIGQVVEHFRAHGNGRAVLQIAPFALPADWDEIRDEYRLTHASTLVKLGAEVAAIPPAATDLRIAPVTPEHADQWAAVILATFGMPGGLLTGMLTGSVRHPQFHPYAAWAGDRIVAAANVFVDGEVASLNTGATVPEFRGRGAQSALIAVRAEVARQAGCRWIVAETGAPADGEHNPSLDNLRRLGLHDLYLRDNWVWQGSSLPEDL